MKNTVKLIIMLSIFLASCGQRTTDQAVDNFDSTKVSPSQSVHNFDSVKNSPSQPVNNLSDLFLDTCFTFLSLNFLDEEMLRDSTIKNDYKYIESIKRFTKDHCNFFRTGCSSTFFDDHVFFVSKQKKIGEILPVIIHDSKDFNYYHSDLYTLDKNYNKIDSIRVSLAGSGIESDEPSIYYETKIFSKFDDNRIVTTEVKHLRYGKGDSTVTKDSTVVYMKIEKNGKIMAFKKEKII